MQISPETFLPIKKIGTLEDRGFILDAQGNITFCLQINGPEIFDLPIEKSKEIFKNLQGFIDSPLTPGGTVLHQQDFYFSWENSQTPKTTFYAQEKWNNFFKERVIFQHQRFLYLTYPHQHIFPKAHQTIAESVQKTKEKMEAYQNHALGLCNSLCSFLQQNKAFFDQKIEVLSENAIKNLIFAAYLNRDFSVFKNLNQKLEDNYYIYPFLRDEKKIMQKLANINIVSLINEGEETYYFKKSNLKELSEIEKNPHQNPIFNKTRIFELSGSFPIALALVFPHIVNTKMVKIAQSQQQKIIEEKLKKTETVHMFSTVLKQKSDEGTQFDALKNFDQELQKENKNAVFLQQNVISFSSNEAKAEKYLNTICTAYSQMGVEFTLEDYETAPLFFQNVAGGGTWGENRFILTTSDRATAYFPLETLEKSDATGVNFLNIFGNPMRLDFRYNPHLSNYNMLVVGGSGKGKSVFTNHILQHQIDQKNLCFLFDKGGSYEYLVQSNGGSYIDTAKKENLTFSPFLILQDEAENWLFDDQDHPEKTAEIAYEKEKIMRILEHIFAESHPQKKSMTLAERNVFLRLLNQFYEQINKQFTDRIQPSLTYFYIFCREEIEKIKEKNELGSYLLTQEFQSFLMACELFVEDNLYCKKGEYHYLLNGKNRRSLIGNHIIAIDLQAVSENPVLYQLCMTLFLDAVQFTIEKIPNDVFKAVVIDEGIDMFVSGGRESKFIGTTARKIRKHGGGLTLIIQHLKIFETMPAHIAGDLEGNLAIKVVLGLDGESAKTFQILSDRLGMDQMDLLKIASLDASTDFGREYYIKMGKKGYLARLFLPSELLLMYSTTPELLEIKKKMYQKMHGNIEKMMEHLQFLQKKYQFEAERSRYKLIKKEVEEVF